MTSKPDAHDEGFYNWKEKASFFARQLGLGSALDSSKTGDLFENLGYSFYRASMQSDSKDEFHDRIRQSSSAYQKSQLAYQRSGRRAERLRSQAMESFLHYWIAPQVAQRRKLLIRSSLTAIRALEAFRRCGDNAGFGTTFNELALAVGLRFNLEWNMKTRLSILRRMVSLGEEAVDTLSRDEIVEEEAKARVITAGYVSQLAYYSDGRLREKFYPKCDEHLRKALEISERAALLELAKQSKYAMLYIGGAPAGDRGIATIEKSLHYSRETRDRFVVSSALEFLAYNLHLRSTVVDDPEERESLAKRWMQLADEAMEASSPITIGNLRQSMFFVVPPYASYHLFRAGFSLGEDQRRNELAEAQTLVRRQLELSKEAGVPDAVFLAHYNTARILAQVARMEPEHKAKLKALQTAAQHARCALSILPRTPGILSWEKGGLLNNLAQIEFDRTELQTDPSKKRRTLQRGIMLMEKSLSLRSKVLTQTSDAVTPAFGYQAKDSLELGDIYVKLHRLSQETEDLRRAELKFVTAAALFQRVNQRVRMAEAYWRSAITLERLSEHIRASEHYSLASNNYNIGAQRIPTLRKFYEEHAFYMQARSEIEQAKNYHLRRDYSNAKECYKRATSLHTSSRAWSYLAPFYSAWANMENAEDLAQRIQTEEAIQSFEEAVRFFKETIRSVQSQLPLIGVEREMETARLAIGDSENWERFAKARIIIEKARIQERLGDFDSSWDLCAAAIRTLEELQPRLTGQKEAGREISYLLKVCLSCQVISKAETDPSPESFRKAAEQFDSWRTHSSEKQSRVLMQAHSSFYEALALGFEYGQSRNNRLYSEAKRCFDEAADNYLRAGLSDFSEKSRATALLFDSYFYQHKAGETEDPDKKTSLYKAAEKLLATSSATFGNAGFSEKRLQVEALLEKTKKDREIAVSLSEILAKPGLVPLPTSPSVVGPVNNFGPGPEKFGGVIIQAELSIARSLLNIGDDFELKLAVANAGNNSATLLHVEGLVPRGFEAKAIPDSCKLELGNLVLRGRRLAPLKSEELILVLKPRVYQDALLQPTIVYLDETGRQSSYTLEPVRISVRHAKPGEGMVNASLTVSSTEFFVGEGFECKIEIATGTAPVVLHSIENCAPDNLEVSKCEGGILEGRERRIDLRDLRFDPGETHTVRLAMLTKTEGTAKLAPSLRVGGGLDSSRAETIRPVEITIHSASPILCFLADAYAKDDAIKRVSKDQAGWRTLLNIASSLMIPRSQVYGEPRYGHEFGRPIETLLRAGLIEYRTFPGRGRGGNITKVRIVHERDAVRRLVESLRPSSILQGRAGKELARVSSDPTPKRRIISLS